MRDFGRVATALAVATLATGCGFTSSRAGFVSDAEAICERAAGRIANNPRPLTPDRGVKYAIDVFQEKDRLLIQLRELSLPSDDDATLRERWLDPAQHDLDTVFARLPVIRDAGRDGDFAAVRAEVAVIDRAGTGGVDVDMLSDYGLPECAELFTEPS